MNLQADNLIALAVVGAALAYLGRRAWLTLAGKRRGGCGSCGNCPVQASQAGSNLIGLEALAESAKKVSRAR